MAVAAGVLFIAATVASLLGTAIEQPVLNGPDYLTSISANATRIAAGGFLELVAAGTSAGIALSLYPVLKNWSGGLALGSVVFRTIEAVMYTAGAVTLLSSSTVSDQLASAASADRASLQAITDSILAMRQEAVLTAVFAFSVGALMYYLVFYQSGLIPGWLSGWGVAAAFLMLVACLAALFGRSPVTSYTIMIIPIAVQEMVLAVWLIVKGILCINSGLWSLVAYQRRLRR